MLSSYRTGEGKLNIIMESFNNLDMLIAEICGISQQGLESKTETCYRDIMLYVNRLMDLEISDSQIHQTLKKIRH